jgi:hypothetical protein
MNEDRRRHKETNRKKCSRHSGSRLSQSVFNISQLSLGIAVPSSHLDGLGAPLR